jgi:dihydropteroate synthase
MTLAFLSKLVILTLQASSLCAENGADRDVRKGRVRARHLMRFRELHFDATGEAVVMGILNVTPDSFYDKGRYRDVDRARARAAEMVEQGARILDVGGRSYAVNAVDAREERARVVPAIEALVRDNLGVALSVDTMRPEVAEAVLAAGAHLINDCSGLYDERLAKIVARYDAGLVVLYLDLAIAHGMIAEPQGPIPARTARATDLIGEIIAVVNETTQRALDAGVARESIVVDPGLEFSKDLEIDLELLARYGELRALRFPILMACSRKDFLGNVLNRPASELLAASLAVATIGALAGAAIVRAHDVAQTVDVARLVARVRAAGARTQLYT